MEAGQTPILVHNVNSCQVEYGSTDLSKQAIAARKTNGWTRSARNVSVWEYKDSGGALQTLVARSGPRHAERMAWDQLQSMGVSADSVTRVYTELAPCSYAGCSAFLNQFTNASVTHSFEYGLTSASRRAGVNALKRALTQIRNGVFD
ncbi:nucleic acid/nucleotide deaminase domain-containing protein [Streptomyces sp. NPDC051104]|uniref:nucleic acid/nucleotide deaminase domain-containing protein n=1 Tax=Streptomyces sp. NPDC051104 TaxID=3155044 RepID=UPI00341CE94D